MSTSEPESQHDPTAPPDDTDPAQIHAEIAVLEAENARLREEYTRARQVTYWRTAIALLGVGVIGLLGGLVFPDARVVLFALGGTGVFAGVLTYFLTPEQFISGRVGTQVFQALIEDRDAAIDELGLAGDPVYMPGDAVRLFVPRTDTEQLPDRSDLTDLFVVPTNPKRGGVAFHSTGDALLEEVTPFVISLSTRRRVTPLRYLLTPSLSCSSSLTASIMTLMKRRTASHSLSTAQDLVIRPRLTTLSSQCSPQG